MHLPHSCTPAQLSSAYAPTGRLLARLRSAAPGVVAPAQTAAGRDAVLALVAVLKTLGTVREDLNRATLAQLAAHPDGPIFTSFPRSGQVNAAQMLAEWGDARDARDGPDAVAAFAGVAPVTKASGRMHDVAYPVGLQQTLPPGPDRLRRPQPTLQLHPQRHRPLRDEPPRLLHPGTASPARGRRSPAPGTGVLIQLRRIAVLGGGGSR